MAVEFSVHSPHAQTPCRLPPAVRHRLPSAVRRPLRSSIFHRPSRTGLPSRRDLDARARAALGLTVAPAILRGRYRLFAASPRRVFRARGAARGEHRRHRHARPVPLCRLRRASAQEPALAAHAAVVHGGGLPAVPHLGDPRLRARAGRGQLRSGHPLLRRLERLHRRLHRLVHAHRERGRLRAAEAIEQGGDHAHLPERRSFPHAGRREHLPHARPARLPAHLQRHQPARLGLPRGHGHRGSRPSAPRSSRA